MEDERMKLIPLGEHHIETIRLWRNDPEIRKYFFNQNFINKNQQEKWFENYCKDNSQMTFAILEKSYNSFIGTIGLSNIDHYNQRAELGTLIGNKEYWGKGYATIATKILLSYAFKQLNLQKVYCSILIDNIGSIKKNEKVGFEIEGTQKNHAFNNGEFKDVIVMGLLRENYKKIEM